MENVTAIIVAGGSGKRMGGSVAKQYLQINGLPILVHTIRRFEETGLVRSIILVVPEQDITYVKRLIVEDYGFTKVRCVIQGGKERQDSVRNGLWAERDAASDIIIIHDAVRPFFSSRQIELSIQAAREYGAVVMGVPVKDTVKFVAEDGVIKQTPDRTCLWLAQTPQTFRKDLIVQAYEKAYADGFYGTDDASLVERTGYPVKMLCGSYHNIKVTTPEDIALCEFLYGRFTEKG